MEEGGRRWSVAEGVGGERLDRAAAALLPEAGLRGRRRLIEAGRLLVDGRPRPAGYRVRVGEVLELVAGGPDVTTFVASDVPVVADTGEYAVVAKPAGLHSAAIAHGGGPSLEALLPELFPCREPVLLSRLDCLTTGLVPVAFAPGSATLYRRLEAEGEVEKTYLAVAHGVIGSAFTVAFELDARDRAKTRVRARGTSDPLRWTALEPVSEREGLSLVRCRIGMGARHQIRAHLAASGHPLVGDPLYGRGEGRRLFLHCAALRCPLFASQGEPPWSLADAVRTVLEDTEEAAR